MLEVAVDGVKDAFTAAGWVFGRLGWFPCGKGGGVILVELGLPSCNECLLGLIGEAC
jgi:hypothetical protein